MRGLSDYTNRRTVSHTICAAREVEHRAVLEERRGGGLRGGGEGRGLAGPPLILRLSMVDGAEGAGAKILWLLLFIGAQCPVSPKQSKGRMGGGVGSSYGCQPF